MTAVESTSVLFILGIIIAAVVTAVLFGILSPFSSSLGDKRAIQEESEKIGELRDAMQQRCNDADEGASGIDITSTVEADFEKLDKLKLKKQGEWEYRLQANWDDRQRKWSLKGCKYRIVNSDGKSINIDKGSWNIEVRLKEKNNPPLVVAEATG